MITSEVMEFIRESNRIEGITRSPTRAEIAEFERFIALDQVTVEELQTFVSVYQPGAVLRDQLGLNVIVGNYSPPQGGPKVRKDLTDLLDITLRRERPRNAWWVHIEFERLHPFTDGNGRSGRMLWAWMYRDLSLGFLHRFYYQTLHYTRSN